MADDCIFCKIIRGEIPCQEVYSTDKILAFLDISPAKHGHTLVIAKEHHETILDMPDALAVDLQRAIQKVGRAVMQATQATGFNLGMNNYKSAGQVVPHAHYHVIPRHDDDGLVLWDQNPYEDQEEMQRLAAAIKQAAS